MACKTKNKPVPGKDKPKVDSSGKEKKPVKKIPKPVLRVD